MFATDLARIESRIYEAAIVTELWPEVLADLSEIAEGDGGVLFSVGRSGVRFTSSENVRHLMQRFVNEGWIERNSRAAGVVSRGLVGAPRFVTEVDYFAPGQMDTDEMVNEFLRPAKFGWAAGTLVELPEGDIFTVTIEQHYDRGPIEGAALDRLNLLRPHISRAAMLATRLALDRMRTGLETLEAVGIAGAALAASGRILCANAAFEGERDLWLTRGGERLVLVDAQANAALYDTLASIAGPEGRRSIPLMAENGAIAALIQVLPVRRKANDYFQSASAIVVVSRPRLNAPRDPTVLAAIFDLTAAEARVVALVGAGLSLQQIAIRNSTSINTVRTQIGSAMQKCGCRRQVDLVRMLADLWPML